MSRLRPTAEEWERLELQHPVRTLEVLRIALDDDGLVEYSVEAFATAANCDPAEAAAVLDAVADIGVLSQHERWTCNCCHEELIETDVENDLCPHCERAFADCSGGSPKSQKIYLRWAPLGRDPSWVLVVHGMNTTGPWQEELSWLCATTYSRSLPVFIYKYGKVRPGAILKWRQAHLAQRLSERMVFLSSVYGSNHDPRPDVIAHSLGTLLLGEVLMRHAEIRVGRVILAGSILRPDFEWDRLIKRGQVEAVLNHCAEHDRWVPVAPFVIPGSGPSGTRGFAVDEVVHRHEPKFGHSSFFEKARMDGIYRDVWDAFLTRPSGRLPELRSGSTRPWHPLPVIVPAVSRMTLLFISCLLGLLATAALLVGAVDLISWLR